MSLNPRFLAVDALPAAKPVPTSPESAPKAGERQEKTMASDDKKTKAEPAPKTEAPPKSKSTADVKSTSEAKSASDVKSSADAKSTADAAPAKAEGGGKEAGSSAAYHRGEGQKPVSQAYRDNWNLIFGEKKKR